jgi:DNA-binding transcriptional ArsR family regulator
MGISKSNLFSNEHNRIAELSKALGHPARVAIIEYLMHKKSCVCGDIVSELPLSQATISQHLKALKSVGIIKGEIDGAFRCYCLNSEVIAFFKERINLFFNINQKCC